MATIVSVMRMILGVPLLLIGLPLFLLGLAVCGQDTSRPLCRIWNNGVRTTTQDRKGQT